VGALPGQTLNPDQSFKRNQLDGRFNTPLNPKATLTVKARSMYFEFRNAALGRNLDRIENLVGVAGDYAVLPETKVVGEYRRQDVYYRKVGERKNKGSDYLMAGVDHTVAKKLSASARVGAEWRTREAEESTRSPYVEVSGKYDFTERSYLAAGYAFTLEETSDTTRFTDTRVQRLFANVQHYVTAMIAVSGSVTYEPSVLQGRRGVADLDEDTVRAGVAVSYVPNQKWTVSLTYDHDRVYSQDAPRDMRRARTGLSAIYSF
jgi:predicted porin